MLELDKLWCFWVNWWLPLEQLHASIFWSHLLLPLKQILLNLFTCFWYFSTNLDRFHYLIHSSQLVHEYLHNCHGYRPCLLYHWWNESRSHRWKESSSCPRRTLWPNAQIMIFDYLQSHQLFMNGRKISFPRFLFIILFI